MAVALNATQDYLLLAASHTSASGTNVVETFEAPLNVMHKGVLLVLNRTADTGTCTLDAKVQFYSTVAAAWLDVEGAAFVQYADGATGARYLLLYPGVTGAEADDAIPLNTSKGVKCGQYLPRQWRVAVTVGGTTVTSTYALEAHLLP